LDLALNAHGGLDRWRQVQSLDVRISLTGGLHRLKGHPDGVPNALMHVRTRRVGVDVSPWIGMGTGKRCPDEYTRARSCGGKPLSTASRNMPTAFLKLLKGENFGKMLLKLR
jgi:hypothetical protein